MGTGNSTLGAMTLGSVLIARRSWEFFIREKKTTQPWLWEDPHKPNFDFEVSLTFIPLSEPLQCLTGVSVLPCSSPGPDRTTSPRYHQSFSANNYSLWVSTHHWELGSGKPPELQR